MIAVQISLKMCYDNSMLREKLKEAILKEVKDAFKVNLSLEEIEIEKPREKENGDYSSPVSFSLAKKLKKDPSKIAKEISRNLKREEWRVEEKGGFINFFFSDKVLFDKAKEGVKFNKKNKLAVVDYSSPNIAKSFGIGHLRSTIIGQAMVNIYRALGWKVVGLNYLGDWGTQYGKLIFQIKKEGVKEEDLTIEEMERLYVKFHKEAKENPDLEEKGREWFRKLEEGDKEAMRIWEICSKKSLKEFEETYRILGVEIDKIDPESFYKEKAKEIIKEAKDKKIARESKGALIIDLPNLPPAMLLKSGGGTTYFARDLAAVKYRVEKWTPDLFIYEVGSDQKLHLRQLFEAVSLFGWAPKESFFHMAHGLFRKKGGKMSTRKGETIHLKEVLNKVMEGAKEMTDDKEVARQVGIGAIKYQDLKRDYRRDIIFDWEEMLSLKGNSGPYLQYSAVRARSVLDKSKKKPSYK